MQVAVWFGAVPGTSIQAASARPTASGTLPATGATAWASGSAGRLAREPLPHGRGAQPVPRLALLTRPPKSPLKRIAGDFAVMHNADSPITMC